MKVSGFTRRDFMKTGTGTALVLATQGASGEPLQGCAAPPAAIALPANVGIAYREHYRGDAGLELELDFEIDDIAKFLGGPHTARLTSGSIGGAGLPKTSLKSGSAELFRPCASGTELTLNFEYQDAHGKTMSGVGRRALGPANQRDPAAELAELWLELSGAGAPQSATLRSDISDMLDRLVSVRALRAEGAVAAEARQAFLELVNRGCEAAHPELPTLIDATITLPAAERRALLLAATVMLPQPPLPGGPSVCQALQQLSTFVANADKQALADLLTQLRLLGRAEPFLRGFIGDIRTFVLDVLQSERPNLLRPLLDSLHKV
ncbi:MAG TPA: hypothetical protein VEQ59_08215, partial [Polyangiaceae bacterium]|nr:hypothetical protein [Polyangiaceae bacterium]